MAERLSATLLMTKSGRPYHLMGPLSLEEMAKESPELKKKVLKKFKKGFPVEWAKILLEAKTSTV